MVTETTWWCYVLRPTRADILHTGPTPEEETLMGAHWAYTTDLHARGRIALAGRTTGEDSFAEIVVDAPDEASARRIVDEEPGVVGGLFTAELHPFELMLTSASPSAPA